MPRFVAACVGILVMLLIVPFWILSIPVAMILRAFDYFNSLRGGK